MKTNKQMVQEYIITRGLKQNTFNTYYTVLTHYSNHQQKTLQELIQEADQEEEQRIRWKHRTLKNRLITYGNYCKNQMKITSAKNYMNIIKSFYRHHEIEIGSLPNWNLRNSFVNDPVTYNDLPDKELIRQAVEISKPLMRSLILFLSSTGMSKVDALNLDINSFVIATASYHHNGDIIDILEELLNQDNVIPTFKARRVKTNKYFVTFCTPEATHEICNYLKKRSNEKKIKVTDKLFKISTHWYTVKFEEINKILCAGKVGAYNRFRGHMLRKFHASNLEKAGMDRTKVNVLQGKSNGAVDDVYFFHDEQVLKNEYIHCMHELLILSDVNSVDVYSEEYLELLNQKKELQSQVDKLHELEVDISELKSDLGL